MGIHKFHLNYLHKLYQDQERLLCKLEILSKLFKLLFLMIMKM